jgi:hypothetical protein
MIKINKECLQFIVYLVFHISLQCLFVLGTNKFLILNIKYSCRIFFSLAYSYKHQYTAYIIPSFDTISINFLLWNMLLQLKLSRLYLIRLQALLL